MSSRIHVAALIALAGFTLLAGARQTVLPPGVGEPAGAVLDLGTLGGSSSASDINTWGVVTGRSATFDERTYAIVTTPHDTMRALQVSGDGDAFGMSINDRGDVAGIADAAGGRNGFLYAGGAARDLGPGWPQSLNNLRDVAGWAWWPPDAPAESVAMAWNANGVARLLGPAGKRGEALDVNDRGEVVGWMADPGGVAHAVIWEPDGTVVDLGFGGGIASTAVAINEIGDVAGFRYAADSKAHAFIWRSDTGMTDLFPPDVESQATDLNNAGEIVGVTIERDGEYRAIPFVWDAESGATTLANPIGNTGRTSAINDLGEIVGYANEPVYEGASHALWWYQPPTMAAEFEAIRQLIGVLRVDQQINRGHATALAAQLRSAERAWNSGDRRRAARGLAALADRVDQFVRDQRRSVHLRALLARLALSGE